MDVKITHVSHVVQDGLNSHQGHLKIFTILQSNSHIFSITDQAAINTGKVPR